MPCLFPRLFAAGAPLDAGIQLREKEPRGKQLTAQEHTGCLLMLAGQPQSICSNHSQPNVSMSYTGHLLGPIPTMATGIANRNSKWLNSRRTFSKWIMPL